MPVAQYIQRLGVHRDFVLASVDKDFCREPAAASTSKW